MRFVLFTNGDLPSPDYARSLLREDDLYIAVNGGTRVAREVGVVPHLLIGDSDSLPASLQQWLSAHQVPRQTFPAEKDATDFELAVQHAIGARADAILCIGLTGNRIDHTVANLSVLSVVHHAGIHVEAINGEEHIFLVSNELLLEGEAGQTVSLIPWGGNAEGVETTGMKWELQKETLYWGQARGISNVMQQDRVSIRLSSGLLLVCQHRGEVC
jgi:thiamine pyrophosphokinase